MQGVFDYTGGALTGYEKDPDVDEFERKEQLRKNRRRPIQETLDEVGEGRGKTIFTSVKIVSNNTGLQEYMDQATKKGGEKESSKITASMSLRTHKHLRSHGPI